MRSPKVPRSAGVVAVAVALLLGAVWPLGGCEESTIVTQEVVVDEPLGAAAVTDVEINMGAGRLTVAPGATGLASGTIRCNLESWQPVITRTDTKLTIKQGAKKDLSGLGDGIVNEWDLQLGKSPMRLKVSAGVYEGTYDLGGLTLQELTIKDGAAQTQVTFNTVNPGQMQTLTYETGVSSVKLIGLANANFKKMEFKGGAGNYSLDFSGELRTNGIAKVKAGAGSVTIIVPAATAARVTVTGSLNSISTEGVWTLQNDTYSTTAVGTAGQSRLLTIEVEVDAGSIELITK